MPVNSDHFVDVNKMIGSGFELTSPITIKELEILTTSYKVNENIGINKDFHNPYFSL